MQSAQAPGQLRIFSLDDRDVRLFLLMRRFPRFDRLEDRIIAQTRMIVTDAMRDKVCTDDECFVKTDFCPVDNPWDLLVLTHRCGACIDGVLEAALPRLLTMCRSLLLRVKEIQQATAVTAYGMRQAQLVDEARAPGIDILLGRTGKLKRNRIAEILGRVTTEYAFPSRTQRRVAFIAERLGIENTGAPTLIEGLIDPRVPLEAP